MGSLLPRAALVLWACLWAGADGYQEAWGSCDRLVCQEVLKQAEGILRFKQMRNYILRTMHVMTNLLTSLDEEVSNTSKDMELFVGLQCQDVQPLLREINMNEEEVEDEFTWEGQEVQSAGDQHRPGDGSPGTLEVSITQTDREVTPSVNRSSSTAHENSTHRSSTDDDFTNKFGPTATGANKAIKMPETFGSGGTGSAYGGADAVHTTTTHSTWGSSTSSGWNSGASKGYTAPDGSWGNRGGSRGGCGPGGCRGGSRGGCGPGGCRGGSRGSSTEASGSSQCRGVPRESPFWVPGLDQWCLINCASGYCPSNMCVC